MHESRFARFNAILVIVTVTACGALGCKVADPSNDMERAGIASFDELFAQGREIVLEESDSQINVTINVTVHPNSEFLIADQAEGTVRVYDSRGRLAAAYGRQGDGPREFRQPVALIPFGEDSLLAIDMTGRLTVIGPDGGVRTVSTGLTPVYSGQAMSRDTIVLAARTLRDSTVRLHYFAVGGDTTIEGEVIATIPSDLRPAFNAVGIIGVAPEQHTIAVTLATYDTLYRLDRRSGAVRPTPLPFAHFRRITAYRPNAAGMNGIREWLRGFSLVSEVYPLSTRTMLVQYQDRPDMYPRFRLMAMDSSGNRLFDLFDSPRLLAVMPGDTLVFQHPDSEVPNRWLLATLR
jgi:hypothetical protein